MNLPASSVLNFECLYILWTSIRHPSHKCLLFEFAHGFRVQFRVSQHIMGRNWTFELKVMAVWVFQELLFSILSLSIYYGLQSNIRGKSYCRLNLPEASFINFKHLNILWASIRHPSKKLWPFEFAQNFYVQFWGSQYIMGHNQTFVSKVMTHWIFLDLPC